MNSNLYRGFARLVCYEGETPTVQEQEAAAAAALAAATSAGVQFTPEQQAYVNKIAAEERRKTESKYKPTLEKTEQKLQQALDTQKMTAKEREDIESTLEDVRTQLRTKDQQAAIEKKKLEDRLSGELKVVGEKATYWENQYKEERIVRALKDAAVENKVVMPDLLVDHLKSKTKLVEDENNKGVFHVVVDFEDTDPETQQPVKTVRSPAEVVKRMKDIERYHPLFGSSAAGGVGGAGNPGGRKPDLKAQLQTPQGVAELVKLFREKGPSAAAQLQ